MLDSGALDQRGDKPNDVEKGSVASPFHQEYQRTLAEKQEANTESLAPQNLGVVNANDANQAQT